MRGCKKNWNWPWEDYVPTHFTDPPLKITEKGDVAHGQEWFPLCERFAIHRTNIIKTD